MGLLADGWGVKGLSGPGLEGLAAYQLAGGVTAYQGDDA